MMPSQNDSERTSFYASRLYPSRPTQPCLQGLLTTSSAQAGYPVTNLHDFMLPRRPWVAGGVGDQWVLATFPSPTAIGAVYLGWIDFGGTTRLHVQANDTDVWTGTLLYDREVTVDRTWNPLTERRCYICIESFTAQYVRVVFPDTTFAARLGQLAISDQDGVFVPSRPPFSVAWTQARSERVAVGGGRRVTALGARRMTLEFDWEWAFNFPEEAEGEDALILDPNLQADVDSPVLVAFDAVRRPELAAIFQPVGEGLTINSAQGVGGHMALAYEEVMG